MGETIATRRAKTVMLDKERLLELLAAEMARAKVKLATNIPGEYGGLRARLDACEKLRAQISPLDDAAIAKAREKNDWLKQPFPFDLDERLAVLAADAMV